jgi:hypothetical protein
MKRIILSFLLLLAIQFAGCRKESANYLQTINPVIGDISYIKKFGHAPAASTPDQLRIKTHLEYVAELLRQKDVSHLSPELQKNRTHLLDLLYSYAEAGVFPVNYDRYERRPCFIDKNGTICAVGYLIEQTAGREAAEKINTKHKYDHIFEMKDEAVDAWIATSGLTKEECAMIQPQYKPTTAAEITASVIGSYRTGDNFYPSIDVSIQEYELSGYRGTTQTSIFSGAGIRLDYLREQNFQFGLRIYSQFLSHRRLPFYPLWAFAPECFLYNKTVGMNFKPELGIIFSNHSPFSFHILYGYDIPVVAGIKFDAGRSDLSAKFCVSVTRLCKKDDTNKSRKQW